MKTLLTLTTSIVAASLAMGFSTAAHAQLTLSGNISLGWSGFDSDEGNSTLFMQDVSDQKGSLDFSFDVSADAPEHGLTVFGYADMVAAATVTNFESMDVMLKSAAIGASGREGALLARIGGRETSYAYASDLAVGGAGVSTKFLDESMGSMQPFNSIELIYAHAQGPLSFSAAFEPETGKMSGAAGYDFATTYGPARINGYAFEDPMNNMKEDIDAIRGYRVGAFVDNGQLEFGGNIAVEDIDVAAGHVFAGADIDRLSWAVGARMAVQADLDLSLDYEQGELEISGVSMDYNAFSVGGEFSVGDSMTIGAYFKQMEDMPTWDFSDRNDDGDADFSDDKLISGTELGLNVSVSF